DPADRLLPEAARPAPSLREGWRRRTAWPPADATAGTCPRSLGGRILAALQIQRTVGPFLAQSNFARARQFQARGKGCRHRRPADQSGGETGWQKARQGDPIRGPADHAAEALEGVIHGIEVRWQDVQRSLAMTARMSAIGFEQVIQRRGID